MTFLRLRSPLGGKVLSTLWRAGLEHNTKIKADKEPSVINDLLALKIGYLENDLRKGDSIAIRRSDAVELYRLLKRQFGE